MNQQAVFWKLSRAGASSLLVAVLNFSLIWIFACSLGPRVSFTLAYFLAAAAHFALSKYWTFGDRRPDWARQVPAFLVVVVASYAVRLLVFHTSLRLPGAGVLLANALAVPAGTLVSFSLMQLWVFAVPHPRVPVPVLADAVTTACPDPRA